MQEYDKPKVTIDLNEYNELLSWKDAKVGDEYVQMAKIVVAVVINNMRNPSSISETLRERGILFSIVNTTYSDVRPENIFISLIKDENIKP